MELGEFIHVYWKILVAAARIFVIYLVMRQCLVFEEYGVGLGFWV